MAHNPSYVGQTHVVSHQDESGHEILGVHPNYGAARRQVDESVHGYDGGDKRPAKRSGGKGEWSYHHPDEEHGDLSHWYHIHREKPGGGFEKV